MSTIIVLAGSALEGRRFAAAAGLRGARVVFDGRSALGILADVILELPGFATNPSRFGIEPHLHPRRYQDQVRMLVDEQEAAELTRPKVPPVAHQTTIEEQIEEHLQGHILSKDCPCGPTVVDYRTPEAKAAEQEAAEPAKPAYAPRSRKKAQPARKAKTSG